MILPYKISKSRNRNNSKENIERGAATFFPIDPEIIRKRAAIPEKIAQLSYKDEDAALRYIRQLGEHRIPITTLFNQLDQAIRRVN